MGMEYFGDKLKAIRKSSGFTQTELARRLNMSVSTISAYEQNAKYPSLSVLIQLCEILDVSSDYLLGIGDNVSVKTGGLTSEQVRPFLEIISIVEKYNMLISKE